jgi:RecA-family ATPase
MFLSLDTPKNILVRRWLKSKPPFDNKFNFAPNESFDCLHPDFKTTSLYKMLQAQVKEHKIRLIAVDSLRDVFNGEMNNDDVPKAVYNTFQEWFDGATVIFIHHTRKQQFINGKPVEGSFDDEATGTKYWINKAQVALYLRKQNQTILRLDMGKSQCFAPWNESIQLEMDDMDIHIYDEVAANNHRIAFNAATTALSAIDPKWSTYSNTQKVAAIAAHLKIDVRTAWRWKKESRTN